MNRSSLFFKKHIVMFGLMASLFMFVFGLTFMGCDNGDSYEAKLEDARIALDEGNYSLARSILEGLPRTPEVLQYLSNAISGGELNLDTLNIISTMADLEDNGEQGSIDMIGLIIGDDNNELTASEIASKLDAATESIDLFLEIAEASGTGVDGLSDDQKIQLGLLSITRTVLTLSSLISDEIGGEPVVMTEEWIKDNRDDFSTLNPDQDDLDRIEDDLTYTEYAIGVFTDSNDLKDDYEGFKDELDSNQDGQSSADELNAYIANM